MYFAKASCFFYKMAKKSTKLLFSITLNFCPKPPNLVLIFGIELAQPHVHI